MFIRCQILQFDLTDDLQSLSQHPPPPRCQAELATLSNKYNNALRECQSKEDRLIEEEGRVQSQNREITQ